MKSIIRCIIHPTEDFERVEEAIGNILGSVSFSTTEFDEFIEIYYPEATIANLTILRQFIHEKRILDAVRVRLRRNYDELKTYLHFDKQAAYNGKIRLIDNTQEDPPLGTIEIIFEFASQTEFEEFIDWFSPRTKDGRIIS